MLNSTDKIIKHKTGLLNLAEELGNVSKACQVMGYSRDTFYRYKSAVDEGGVQALFLLNKTHVQHRHVRVSSKPARFLNKPRQHLPVFFLISIRSLEPAVSASRLVPSHR